MTQETTGTSGGRQDDESTADKAREQGQQVAQEAKEQASAVASTAREDMSHMTDQLTSHARSLMDDARGQVKQQAHRQTEQLGGAMEQLGQQIRALAEGRPEDAGDAREYVERIAGSMQQMGSRVSDLGFDGGLDELQRYARRRPGVFLMGAAAAGFMASRLARGARDAEADTSGSTQGSAPRTAGRSSLPPPPPTPPTDTGNALPPAEGQAAPSVERFGNPADSASVTTGRMQR